MYLMLLPRKRVILTTSRASHNCQLINGIRSLQRSASLVVLKWSPMQSLLGEAIPMVYRKPAEVVSLRSKQGMSPPNQPNHMGLGNACSHSYRKRQSSTIAPGELLLPESATPTIVES